MENIEMEEEKSIEEEEKKEIDQDLFEMIRGILSD
jgi:hypothetical protein